MHVISGSHDGALKCWDLRNPRTPLCDIATAHKEKYNEAVCALAVHPTLPIFASGGADSIIRLFGEKM